MLSYVVLACGLYLQGVDGIVGYDCGSPNINVTTFSLLDVQDCNNVRSTQPRVERTYIQLLQRSKFESVYVTQCKVSIDRSVYFCGMHGHISAVRYGKARYVVNITPNQCKQMHRDGTFTVDIGKVISGLKVNQTTTRSVAIAGITTPSGNYAGAYYSDQYGTWRNVVVQGIVTVILTTYRASVNVETNQVELKSGIICRYTDATCLDSDGGYAF
jgi:ribosomal protein S9